MKKFALPLLFSLLLQSVSYAGGIDGYVVFGSHFDGDDAAQSATDFSTAQAAKTITFVGNEQLDTAQKKFGTASVLSDNVGDYLSLADSADWDFGTGDWTVDFWLRLNGTGFQGFFGGGNASTGNYYAFEYVVGQLILFVTGAATILSPSWSPNTGQQYHVELGRSGTTTKLFIDGTAIATNSSDSTDYGAGTAGFFVGDRGDHVLFTDGWIDEFRVSKGICRHTSDFTPETAAYSGPRRIVRVN